MVDLTILSLPFQVIINHMTQYGLVTFRSK